MSSLRRVLAAVLALLTVTPTTALAQAVKVGVVTTLEGNVTVTRVSLPQPRPLKFKDDVLVNDKVTTGDRSIARMLLGGKAVVTVRERSSLTITEVPGKSTIDLDAGKIALAVAKDRMKPGELIEIRTQNAVAGVRGTVVVAEVSRATAQAGGAAPGLVTTFYILRGQVVGQQINPATGAPVGGPVQIGTLQAFRASGIAPATVTNIPPAQVAQIVAGLSASRPQHVSGGGDDAAKDNAVSQTVALANAITGGGGESGGVAAPPSPPPIQTTEEKPTTPLLPGNEQIPTAVPVVPSGLALAHTEINAFNGSIPVLPASVPSLPINFPSLETFPVGVVGWNGPGPYGRINASTLSQSTAIPMMDVPFGATVNLFNGVGLMEVNNSTVGAGRELLRVGGDVIQTGSPGQPLVSIDPSTVTPGGGANLIQIESEASLALTGPLLKSIGSTIDADHHVVKVKGNIVSTTTDPLIDLSGGSVIYGGSSGGSLLKVHGGTITTAGGLIRASGVTFVPPLGDPLISVGSSVTAGGPLLDLASVLNLCGAGCDPVLAYAGNVTVSSGPAFRVNGGTLAAASLASACSGCGLLGINGPLLEIVSGAVSLEKLLNLASTDDVAANLPASTPFVKLTGGSLTTTLDDALLTVAAAGQTGIALSAAPGTTLTLAGSLARLVGASTVDTNPGIQLNGATVTSTSASSLVEVLAASSAAGPVLSMTGGTLTTTQQALLAVNTGDFTISNAVTPGLNGAALQLSGGTVSLGAEMAYVNPGTTLGLDRGLVSAVGTTITTGTSGASTDPFLGMAGGGGITAATASPLVSLSAGSVTTQAGEQLMKIGDGGVTALLTLRGGTPAAPTVTGGGAVLSLVNSPILNIGAGEVIKFDKANASTAGSLYDISNSTITLPTKTLLSVANGSTATTRDADTAAFQFTNSTLTVDRLVFSDGTGNRFDLAGPALQMTNSTLTANRLGEDVTSGTPDATRFASTMASSNRPFARLTNSVLTVTDTGEHDLFGLGDDLVAYGTTTFGVAVIASGSTINTHGSLASFERLTGNATDPMVQLTNTTVSQTGAGEDQALIRVESAHPAGVVLAGPMASITGSSLNLSSSLFYGEEGPTVYNGAAPFIDIVSSTINTPRDVLGLGANTELTSAAQTLLRITGTSTIDTRDAARNTVTATRTVGSQPFGVAVTSNQVLAGGTFTDRVFVTNAGSNSVSFIDVGTGNTGTITSGIGAQPEGVAINRFSSLALVTNTNSNSVSVIDPGGTAPSMLTTITSGIGTNPVGVAFRPDGTRAYVVNSGSGTVSVLDTSTSLPSVLTTVSVGSNPQGIAVRPDGAFAYVANRLGDSISVINTATNAVTATINLPSGAGPGFLAITPDGTRAFVANQFNNTVSVVDLNTRTVVATITGLSSPQGVAITRDGTRAYVTNNGNGTVTVINVGNNTILGTVASAGTSPVGIAIDPESQQAYVADAAAGSTGVKVVGVHNGGSLLTVDPGTDLVSNGSNPVVTATGATIHLGRNAVSAFGTLTVKSPVLVLGSTALDAIGSILNVSRPYDGASTPGLTDTTGSVSADALISATGGSLTSFLGHIVNVGGSFGGEAHLALWRPLFSSSGTTLSSYFHFLRLADGAQFCASSLCGGGLADPLVQISGGAGTFGTSGTGSFLRMHSLWNQLGTVLKLDDGLLSATGGAVLTAAGVFAEIRDGATLIGTSPTRHLLEFDSASATAANNFVAIGLGGTSGGVSGNGAAPVVTLGNGLLHAQTGATPLTFNSGTAAAPRTFVAIFDGAVVSSTAGNFLSFVGSSSARLTIGAASGNTVNDIVFLGTNSGTAARPSLTLAGSLISSAFATLNSGNPAVNTSSNVFVSDGAVLGLTGTAPLFLFDVGTIVNTAGNVLGLARSPSAALPSTVGLGGAALLTASGTAANPVTINGGTTIGLGGNACCSGLFVGQGSLLSSTATGAAIALTNTTWNLSAGGGWLTVSDHCVTCGFTYNSNTLPSTVSLTGGLLSATDSSISSLFGLVFVQRSSFGAGSATSAVLDVLSSTASKTFTIGATIPAGFTGAGTTGFGSIFQVTACVGGGTCSGPVGQQGVATATLGGTLLLSHAGAGLTTTFNTTGDAFRVGDGAVFTSTTTNPVISTSRSAFNVGTLLPAVPHVHFFLVNGIGALDGATGAQVTITGPLLDSSHDVFNIGAGFLETSGGTGAIASRVTFLRNTPTSTPLATFMDSTVNLGAAGSSSGNFIDIRANTAMWTNGPIASVTGGGSTMPWTLDRLVFAQCSVGPCSPLSFPGLDTGSTTDPLFAFNGGFSGTHTVKAALFDLSGTNTTTVDSDPDAPASVLLGTDQPLRHLGPLFQGTGTSMNVAGAAVKLDTALLVASAPLIVLNNSTVSLATSSTANAIDLVQKAKMTVNVPGDAMVRLNNSVLNIVNGHGVNLGGGSFLKITGDLISLTGGSVLSILNGAGINITGGSSLSISGALVRFIGTGNVINITNSICGGACPTITAGTATIPYFATGGASVPTSLNIGPNSIVGLAGNTINYSSSSAAAIVFNGAGSKIKVGQQ